AQRPVVSVAHRREHNPLTVGRIAALGVVAASGRQPLERAALFAVGVDIHLGVVVPRVPSLFPGGSEGEFVVLILLRLRIVMRRRKENLVAAGTEKRTRRLSKPRGNPLHIPARQIERVDLIERVAWFALALEHEPLAVRRPVTLAGAAAFNGQSTDARE